MKYTFGIIYNPALTLQYPEITNSLAENNGGLCSACFCPYEDVDQLSCGHQFCTECWAGYLISKVGDGIGCFRAKCQAFRCNVVISNSFYLKYLPNEIVDLKQEGRKPFNP